MPDEEERTDIFKVILGRYKRDVTKFNLKTLAKNSKGFTGSEIENVVVAAMFNKFAVDGKDIDNQALLDEIVETIPIAKTCEADLNVMREQAKGKLRIAEKNGSVAAFEKGLRKVDMA